MSGPRPDTWMPVYIGDYLADTMHLTRDQHGAYLLLIFAYWRRGGALPDDNFQLAAMTKSSNFEWKKMRPIIAEFFDIGGGVWRHKRIEAELATAIEKTSRRAAAGSKGGSKAAENRRLEAQDTGGKPGGETAANKQQNGQQTSSNATAVLVANAQQNGTPSPSPSPSQEVSKKQTLPPPPTYQSGATDPAEGLAAAFLELREEFWPSHPSLPSPDMTLVAKAKHWVDAGGTLEFCAAHMRRVAAKARDEGKGPPTNLGFCDRSMMDAIRSQPVARDPETRAVVAMAETEGLYRSMGVQF